MKNTVINPYVLRELIKDIDRPLSKHRTVEQLERKYAKISGERLNTTKPDNSITWEEFNKILQSVIDANKKLREACKLVRKNETNFNI